MRNRAAFVLPLLPLLPLLLLSCASGGDPVPYSIPGADPSAASSTAPSAALPDGPEPPVLDLSSAPPAAPAALEPRGVLPPGDDPVIAEVDGLPLRAGEVSRFLFRYDPARALDVLNQLLDARVLEADAAARGVTLPAGEIEARTEEQVRRQEQEVRVQYGPAVTLGEYLRDRFGFSEEAYRADLATLVRLQALRDRLVRYEALREERIRIRVLVLTDEAAARDAARRLREGADFTALAKQVSLAGPSDLPSYRRDEIEPRELADELFSLEPGSVSRPVRVARDGRELFQVFKVVERNAPRDAPWSAVAEEVESGLKVRPVVPAEYLQWARRARERHGVKIRLEEPGLGESGTGGGGR